MRITKTEVVNFRLLENANVLLDDDTTFIVGRNNSGKTSYTEIFNKFLGSGSSSFSADDLSVSAYKQFGVALKKYGVYQKAKKDEEPESDLLKKENAYKSSIPDIVLRIYIEYSDGDNLATIAPFLMDLDPSRNDVLIQCECKIENIDRFLLAYQKEAKAYKNDITLFVRKNFEKFFKVKYYAVDEKNRSNRCDVSQKDIENVFVTQFIHALNQLDDQSTDQSRGLSKGFEEYFNHNNGNEHIEKIEEVLLKFADELGGNYKSLFEGIFSDLKTFGVDSEVNIQNLLVKAEFDSKKVLRGNTKIYYEHDDVLLPEAHNGLGYSKLIFIILSFIGFFEEFSKREPKAAFQLLFIEEPEVHLHPQMQHVFIKNIRKFIEQKKGWNVQIVITTHSSHIVAESGFNSVRYFDISDEVLTVKDLSDLKDSEDSDTINFLQQYMSLNRCDMFFADKVILIEGTVERLLLPRMILLEADKLQSQYISIVEVGGAYAHLFQKLLEFLNVKTLIVTDIDSVDTKNKRTACEVKTVDECVTSNATLKGWLPKQEKITDLLQVTDKKKIDKNIRVAYQIREDASLDCGRSFEQAFILKNAKFIFNNKEKFTSLKGKLDECKDANELESKSYEVAFNLSKKTDFAFDVMLLEGWATPKYISEGLIWLQEQ